MSRWVEIEVIRGVEGDALSINDYRVAGPKPWGGGTIIKKWSVEIIDLQKAIPDLIEILKEEEKGLPI